MIYRDLIKNAMEEKNLSLRQISNLITELYGIQIDSSYLSKLRSGEKPPASDKINDVLAKFLDLDAIELKAAAYREKIPPEVLARIKG
ncbi:XRE family transcriptional regulator [Paenibacillus sp. IHBB 3054]|uniref:XRE family transcriptional regulator n=1 Tax=Paenibacillus sp. IHBB 3054 TaxID=3425689 RepID=UPI003F67B7D2